MGQTEPGLVAFYDIQPGNERAWSGSILSTPKPARGISIYRRIVKTLIISKKITFCTTCVTYQFSLIIK